MEINCENRIQVKDYRLKGDWAFSILLDKTIPSPYRWVFFKPTMSVIAMRSLTGGRITRLGLRVPKKFGDAPDRSRVRRVLRAVYLKDAQVHMLGLDLVVCIRWSYRTNAGGPIGPTPRPDEDFKNILDMLKNCASRIQSRPL